jgi:hypothetical protein
LNYPCLLQIALLFLSPVLSSSSSSSSYGLVPQDMNNYSRRSFIRKIWKNWHRYSPSSWLLDKKNSFLCNYLPNAFMGHCTSTFTVKIKPEHPAPLISESDLEPFSFSSNPHNLRPCEYYHQLLRSLLNIHFTKDLPGEIMYLIAPQL